MIYFTSDLHLGHKNVIRNSNRPYSSIQQMEEDIIKKWNNKIKANDTVYVLGDVTWGWNSNQIRDTFNKLNGVKHMIIGNHDKINPHKMSNVWVDMKHYDEITIESYRVVLSHYPIAEWNGAWYDSSIHLYGHTHGNFDLAEFTKLMPHHNTHCMDIGVDTHNYEPWSWEEIKERLNLK